MSNHEIISEALKGLPQQIPVQETQATVVAPSQPEQAQNNPYQPTTEQYLAMGAIGLGTIVVLSIAAKLRGPKTRQVVGRS